jgi:hypothetical protein
MRTFKDFLRSEIFAERAKERGCLSVYDPERRFRDVVLSLSGDKCRVIDVSESLITKREEAAMALGDLSRGEIHQLILWIPMRVPRQEEELQKDPFAVFAQVGEVFPQGDGDEYADLCRRAKPDHISEINRLFEIGEPSFEMVDAVDEGGSWPKLKTLLGVSSAREILAALLSPNQRQEEALKQDETWYPEAKDFVLRSLAHKLKTRGQTRQSIAEELWRLILFSEFVMDSGGEVPAGLENVPRVGEDARALVFDVCAQLRSHDDHKENYRTEAQEVEDKLGLAERSAQMKNLGNRDTFSCEERIFLNRMVIAALDGRIPEAREIWRSRLRSVWLGREDRLTEWTLAARALDVMETAASLPTPRYASLEGIVQAYAVSWRELDRHHRELEQAANQMQTSHDGLARLLKAARSSYLRAVESLQAEFVRLVEAEGWPITNGQILWNRQIFNGVVDPLLEVGAKVAYFLVDSLRYELGVEVEKQLSDKFPVDLRTVCAQLPTYTEIGMASLMPEAADQLSMESKDNTLTTTLGDKPATTPSGRFAHLKKCKGDMAHDIELEDLVRKTKGQLKIPETAKLLVVRTRDIDAIAHESPHQVLELIPSLVRQIIRGVTKVAELGFDHVVIATDHGFILFEENSAGDQCPKPPGNWVVQKPRCLLGEGEPDKNSAVMKAAELGIPGPIRNYAAPRTLIPYTRGQIYYHEGLSLQECVLPCLAVDLTSAGTSKAKPKHPQLTLTYKQGKTDRITSRRPVVDLAWPEAELFAEESEREVALEAIDSKGRVVGIAGAGQSLNPATGCARIRPGSAISIGLRMEDHFEGAFKVRIIDPNTGAVLAETQLRTAYLQ